LDWGLGHAARCIPIIRELLANGEAVFLGSSGRALQLLRREFPELPAIELPSYSVRYPSGIMPLDIALQSPRLMYAIWKECRLLPEIVRKYGIDMVISDNRYGLFGSGVKSVFITHQLHIRIPFPFIGKLVNALNRWAIGRFDECWVPDREGRESLAGALAHPPVSAKVKYIGPLSRMRALEAPQRYDLVAVLSGPEPQRSRLERRLVAQLEQLTLKALIVQGKPESGESFFIGEHIEVVGYLTSEKLNEAMSAAGLIVARPGYSTIMDLAALGKKALLIPTPGQTEQEYLASYFSERKIFAAQDQSEIDIDSAFREKTRYSGLPVAATQLVSLLEKTVRELVEGLK
jgi:uncharacterized protein (TIGR00661 family)